jgi:hypothetical protein
MYIYIFFLSSSVLNNNKNKKENKKKIQRNKCKSNHAHDFNSLMAHDAIVVEW